LLLNRLVNVHVNSKADFDRNSHMDLRRLFKRRAVNTIVNTTEEKGKDEKTCHHKDRPTSLANSKRNGLKHLKDLRKKS